MTSRLGTWIVRSGDTLRLQLPPMNAAAMFRKELEIVRQGTRLILRGVQQNFVIWEAQVEIAQPVEPVAEVPPAESVRCPRCGEPLEWWPTGIGSIPVCPNEPERCAGVVFLVDPRGREAGRE